MNKDKKSMCYSSTVRLQVNGYDFTFELDTGTYNTIINVHDWNQLAAPAIHSTNTQLRCYSGANLEIKGECHTIVQHANQTYNLPMLIVTGTHPPLLGLQWIKILKLDLNNIIHGHNDDDDKKQIIHKVYNFPELTTILNKYKHVLNKDLGHCNKVKAHIYLQHDTIPKFFKPRPIPFAYLDGVKEEIQRNITAGILERVDTSTWAAPIVPVKKPNGKIRICGDFKVTINPYILVDQHPIPSVDELLARLNNGQKFTKLDLSDAYLQVELDEPSKSLVTINTPLGLFRYNRMPFGISNAPAIFQRIIDQVIAGIPNCIAYLDDILLTGINETEHIRTLEAILQRLSEFGFKCNPEKCLFFQDQVSYLGFIIDKNGKRPDPQRVEAILKMPPPKNVKELEAFIGKVNYYGKFISNFSDKCKVLNELRKKNIVWKWNDQCQKTFNDLLNEISNTTILVHFDNNLPLILSTDASYYGIGAVISHRFPDGSERPIAHASKTLTTAEQNYSQIEKEALSIVYGVKKFHQYLAGRSFILNTDHQPLLTIFNPRKSIPITTANRLQRWAIYLMGYNYVICYKPTRTHANADALSRLPLGYDNSFIDHDADQVQLIQTQVIEQFPLKSTDIALATTNDKLLQIVKNFILTNWSSSISRSTNRALIPFFKNRHSLSIVSGCILKDSRIVVPQQLQPRVLKLLHRSHLGIVKMKQLARSHCWWSTINKDILNVIQSCSICSKLQSLPKPKFCSWEEPKQVWSRLHMDFAGPIWNTKWLIIIDAKSKFPIVADMNNNTTATNLIDALEKVIDWFGPPETLVSDNGPPFNSYDMKKFYDKYNIKHITTPPYHPASNGLAERFVRSFKESMLKQQQAGQTNKIIALRNVLRDYRWTPHTTTGLLPANMMLQHTVRTELDMMKPIETIKLKKKTKFNIGQAIWTLQYRLNHRPEWKQGTVINVISPVIYDIELCNGQHCKRHQNQIRPRHDLNNSSYETDSLPDDLLITQSKPNAINPSNTFTPRYPRRNHKPPERYSP